MNHRGTYFQHSMHHLALFAMVLMLCMPVISRWQQSQSAPEMAPEMCLSEASRAVLAGHAHHPRPDDDNTPPHDYQHNHDACGYCTLATRMLPVLALVLALSSPSPGQHFRPFELSASPTAPDWPAHSPRGPPLHI